jgi:hypothetical protein
VLKSAGRERDYIWQGKELFAYSTELVPVPANSRDLYILYLRYTVGGHPKIFDDLKKLDGIPKWVRYTDPAYGNTQSLDIVETSETPDAPYVLPALEKGTLKDPNAAVAAAAVLASTPASRAAAAEKILVAANAASDGGRQLEAILGYLEGNLMTGEALPPDFMQRRDIITRDANANALFGALRAQNEEQARANIATLKGLASLAGDKAYVVGIFRANMERNLGDAETAAGLFVAALTKNPFITGVWKDLGDSLNTGYDDADTWRCYAIARMIAPTHPLLADIARKEAMLEKEHPEYF